MTAKLDPVTGLVVTLFGSPGVALVMAGGILLFGIGLIVYSGFTEYRPLLTEIRDRWNLLAGFQGSQARKAFHDQFAKLDIRFSGTAYNGKAPAALVLGWANYRSLLVDNEGTGFLTSIRAAEAFDRLDEPARALEWWANILVAVGLVVTFLGIVAALSEATAAMASGKGGGDAMQSALMGLLAIAATKFWTSIAGVLASIILRVVARFRRKSIESVEASLFVTLDGCVTFMPPEKVSLEQLKSLKRLEIALASSKAA
ncbi:hypothetical protein PQU92_06455 [Asticcacaulis sp. BYS171W]|uniref:MotA/TolQ/ExbB proton channel domain-containing protein n=1 Tax=Asticcacaulis aquaticus TaxID=2984212 RepID=A0ABT5HS80_9CAUL|nr:hypothetical protein [Asticcacaulis aquaticus]MDC7682909.1 hypothetical protein [Asticcacaulis aquaticus]